MIILRQKIFVDKSYRNKQQKAKARREQRLDEIVTDYIKRDKVYEDINKLKPVVNPEVEKNIISSRKDTNIVKDPGARLLDDDNYAVTRRIDNRAGFSSRSFAA